MIFLSAPTLRSSSSSGKPFSSNGFVSGLSFGFAGFFYFMIPGNTEVQMLVIALIIGVSFGSMSLYACWLPAFWAFLPTVLLPTMVKLAMIYNISFGVAAFWVGIILLILWYFSTRLNEIYSLSLFRNFEERVSGRRVSPAAPGR